MTSDAKSRQYRENRRTLKVLAVVIVGVVLSAVSGGKYTVQMVESEICANKTAWDDALWICEAAADNTWVPNALQQKVFAKLNDAYWYDGKMQEGIAFHDKRVAENPHDLNSRRWRGQLLYWNNDYTKAITDYEMVFKSNPANQDVATELAASYGETNETSKAIATLTTSINTVAPTSDILRRLGMYYRWNEKWHAAEVYQGLALEKDANNALAYGERAWIAEHDDKLEDALKLANKGLDLEADNTYLLDIRGTLHKRMERYNEAESDFRKILSMDTSASYRVQLADVLISQSKHREAQTVLMRANIDIPDNPKIMNALMRTAYHLDDYKTLRGYADQVLKREPKNFDARYWQASADDAEGKDADAHAMFLTLLKEAPKDNYLQRDIATTLIDLEEFGLAQIHLDAAFAVEPNYIEAWDTQALLYIRKREWDAAAKAATHTIHLKSGRAIPYARRANANWWLDRLDEAEADYISALNIAPDIVWVRVEYADFLITTGKLDKAEAQIKLLLSERAPSAGAYKMRGRLFEQRNDIAAALTDYQKAAETDPSNGWYQEDIAWAKLTLGDTKGSLAACEEMRRILPKAPDGHRCMANVYWRLENLGEARKQFEAGLALNKDHMPSQFDLAKLDQKMGRNAEALEAFSLLINKKYSLARSLHWRGHINAEMGNPGPALRDLEEALKHANKVEAAEISADIQRIKTKAPMAKPAPDDLYPQRR
jgi:tetratricopeptide (TPR) repeat protein